MGAPVTVKKEEPIVDDLLNNINMRLSNRTTEDLGVALRSPEATRLGMAGVGLTALQIREANEAFKANSSTRDGIVTLNESKTLEDIKRIFGTDLTQEQIEWIYKQLVQSYRKVVQEEGKNLIIEKITNGDVAGATEVMKAVDPTNVAIAESTGQGIAEVQTKFLRDIAGSLATDQQKEDMLRAATHAKYSSKAILTIAQEFNLRDLINEIQTPSSHTTGQNMHEIFNRIESWRDTELKEKERELIRRDILEDLETLGATQAAVARSEEVLRGKKPDKEADSVIHEVAGLITPTKTDFVRAMERARLDGDTETVAQLSALTPQQRREYVG